MKTFFRLSIYRAAHRAGLIVMAAVILGCAGTSTGTSSTSSTTTTTTSSVYPAAYQAAKWQSNTTVSFPSACSMSYSTTGVPAVHNAYYLAPAANGQTVVATTPISKMAMAVIPYPTNLQASSVTIDICPTAASATTSTNMGAIGFLISGIALFNSYEATNTVALADNVTYTFTDSSGVMQTASFIDSCNSHGAGTASGTAWHYHGVPNCVTSLVDTSTGPSHLIGFALDGYPIYGGRDLNGNIIPVSQLDACNGITSATPEFSTPTYHYVLPIGVTTSQSSISCYHGTVSTTVMAAAKKLACRMPGMTTAMAAAMPAMKPGVPAGM